MDYRRLHPWTLDTREAREIQQRLRDELILEPPASFDPRLVAGADMSIERFSTRGYAGIVTLEMETMETVETASAAVDVPMPYIPGFLSFRELPALAAAWERLETRPDVVVFDGHGIAHPRRMGIAAHGGLVFDVPSIGCAKSLLTGKHEPVGTERGSRSEIRIGDEVVGMALRTRTGVRPVYVSPGHRMDLATAVELVLRLAPKYREPETTRRSHRLVNEVRKADKG